MYCVVKLYKSAVQVQQYTQWLTAKGVQQLEKQLAKQQVREPDLTWTVELFKVKSAA
jgi:hypothetical protein